MTLDEIQAVINGILADRIIISSWISLVALIIISGLSAFFGAFLRKKGENLATKKDVETLTHKIESVKTEYVKQIEDFKAQLQEDRLIRDRTWIIKKDACLKALNLANAIISQGDYVGVGPGEMQRQHVDVVAVRECYNELASSCEESDVLDQFKKIIKRVNTPADIVDLRNAVRRELKFTTTEIDKDREFAFIGNIVSRDEETH